MIGGRSEHGTGRIDQPPEDRSRPSLELLGIEKRFGDVTALRTVDIAFRHGEVHALLGENGAGKSTLMNITAGFLAPDAGSILVHGVPIKFGAPRDAVEAGIGMIHQHFRLVEQFTVAENLALGAPDMTPITSAQKMNERAVALAAEMGMEIDPAQPVWSLSVGEKQRVEILRTLSRGANIVILDEPTAVLTPDESLRLCQHLRTIARAGSTVIFISHKLNEAMAVADRISVMRNGLLLETKDREECDIEKLSRMMFEEERQQISKQSDAVRVSNDRVVIRLTDVSARDERDVRSLKDVSLTVRSHEIVGVIGVAGNGQQELERVLAGLRRPDEGTVEINGHLIANVQDALKAGLAYIPEDRLGTGLVPTQPIWRNSILRNYRRPPIRRYGVLYSRSAKQFASKLADSVNLSTSDMATLIQHLSGGNAQKLLVGRELHGKQRAVVAVNPTQGLDVRAAMAVRDELLAARNRGLGVLVISADLDEVLLISDRMLVIYEGEIRGEFSREEASRDRIGLLMGGGELLGEPHT